MPTTPCGCAQNGLRRPVAVSYSQDSHPDERECAGSRTSVELDPAAMRVPDEVGDPVGMRCRSSDATVCRRLRLARLHRRGRDRGGDRQPLRDVDRDQRDHQDGARTPHTACGRRSACIPMEAPARHAFDLRERKEITYPEATCHRPVMIELIVTGRVEVVRSERPGLAMHILITEDEPLLARFIARGLQAAGYDTSIAGDGVEALEQIAAHEWDLVVLDLLLPGLDGFDVLAAVAERQRPPRVLVLSARQEVATRVAALDGGASDFLAKPFSFDELLARARPDAKEPCARPPDGLPQLAPAGRRDARGRARTSAASALGARVRGARLSPPRPARSSRASGCSTRSGSTSSIRARTSSTSASVAYGASSPGCSRSTPCAAAGTVCALTARPGCERDRGADAGSAADRGAAAVGASDGIDDREP